MRSDWAVNTAGGGQDKEVACVQPRETSEPSPATQCQAQPIGVGLGEWQEGSDAPVSGQACGTSSWVLMLKCPRAPTDHLLDSRGSPHSRTFTSQAELYLIFQLAGGR